jgi:hypothetical protein
MGRPCEHPLEVCLKFDEMADYVIDQDLGRKINREEAREIPGNKMRTVFN